MRARTTIAVAALALAALSTGEARAQAKKWTDIKSPPLAACQVEKPETFPLKNGMKVFLMEDHELPVININVRVKTGAYWEPQDKVGLARLTGLVMRTGGTTSMTGD